jgi:hypothetical protein
MNKLQFLVTVHAVERPLQARKMARAVKGKNHDISVAAAVKDQPSGVWVQLSCDGHLIESNDT